MNDLSSGYAVDPDLLATFRDVVGSHSPSRHDPTTGVEFDINLWNTLDGLGLARMTGPEEHGGSGATWYESAALLTELATQAVALPLGEHDLLAGWLLATAGLPNDGLLRTAAVLDAAGSARAVPWARYAAHVVCVLPVGDGWRIADVPVARFSLSPDLNLAGEPRDHLRIEPDALRPDSCPVAADMVDELLLRAALVRAVQTAGALERCLRLTLSHVSSRVQFGRPISRFQAVQHLAAQVAAETSLARAAVDAAVAVAAQRDRGAANLADLAFHVAVARSCAGHAASLVVRTAHQLHGAIGTTLEHDLHRATLPALAWRGDYGSTQHWDERVNELATATDDLWGLITR